VSASDRGLVLEAQMTTLCPLVMCMLSRAARMPSSMARVMDASRDWTTGHTPHAILRRRAAEASGVTAMIGAEGRQAASKRAE